MYGAGGRLFKHRTTDVRDRKDQLPCDISTDNNSKAKVKYRKPNLHWQ